RNELMHTINKLHCEGITVINITHHLDEAMGSNRLVVMNQGKIALQGTPKQVFQNLTELRNLKLDVPFVIELADRLRRKGIPLTKSTWNTDELVAQLWKLI